MAPPGGVMTMDLEGNRILWTQFILAAALARTARGLLERAPADRSEVEVCYADTHAGSGHLPPPAALDRVLAARSEFTSRVFHDAVADRDGFYPGSWLLAGRAVGALDEPRLALEIDVNDIDEAVIRAARTNREGGWVRFWSHDWFQFLKSRLAMQRRPGFVFIDPPPDDPRGPGYAIDAAILLDTMAVPYMVTYPVDSPQEPIDQIGRSGLELHGSILGYGALLGGGAEAVVLDVLPDLRRLAALLGGEFTIRLPRATGDDYCI
ncbi:conserved hypothetical protein [Candidatus Terasakiella magnetica]|nr:conserved hypothetical protein [Candidatus Terasakiella magnetica]